MLTSKRLGINKFYTMSLNMYHLITGKYTSERVSGYELHQSIWVTVVARASRFRYSVELPALRDSLHHTFS